MWYWNHWRRGRELMHSTSAFQFYSIPFPSHKSTEVMLGLYFNSFSASVLCFQQFQVQTEFGWVKGRASLFSCAHPGWYTLLLETFFSWRVKTAKNLRKCKEHLGLKYNSVTALSQSPPESGDVFPVGFRWILVRSASCCCQVHEHTLACVQAQQDIVTHTFGWYQDVLVVAVSLRP